MREEGVAVIVASEPSALRIRQAAHAAALAAAREPDTTESVLAGLPRPIAVVGNGTPDRAWGAVIDGYPTVIRLNNFRTVGFEALVGRRTDLWCTSGWHDILPRPGLRACSPFRADAAESAAVAAFNRAHHVDLVHASTDVHGLAPAVSRPSTGFALAQLLDLLGCQADLFGFDGFRTPHYWTPDVGVATTHTGDEAHGLRQLEALALPGSAGPLAVSAVDESTAAAVCAALDGQSPGSAIVIDRAPGALAQALQDRGWRVRMIPVEAGSEGLSALCHTLATQTPCEGLAVAPALLDRLDAHDCRRVLRQLARLVPRALVGGDAPAVRSVLEAHFDVTPVQHGTTTLLCATRARELARLCSPAPVVSGTYELPADYVARGEPAYFDDVDHGVVWQPDVYRLARDLARDTGVRRLIDVGCGQGRKLAVLQPVLDLVGLDFGENLAHCRSAYPWGRWLEADLDGDAPWPLTPADLEGSALVASDVIEHLRRPERLLSGLRQALAHAEWAILTTPDRVATHGVAHLGPPPNPAHVREWALDELAALARGCGLEVALATRTASESTTWARRTSLLVLVRPDLAPAARAHLADRVRVWLRAYDRERGSNGAPRPEAGDAPGAAPRHDAGDALVSIIMRTKDRPAFLARAVASVRAQSYPVWELLVVNDGGDPSVVDAVVAAAANDDRRVRVLHRPSSLGMEDASNAGLAAAAGRYVTLLDDDDTWDTTFLATCVAHLTRPRPSSVRGVVTHAVRVTEHDAGAGLVTLDESPATPGLEAVTLVQLTQRNLFPVNAFVYEREAAAAVGGYRAHLPVLGDWDFNLRFVTQFDVDVLPQPLARVHQRPAATAGANANSAPALHRAWDARLRNAWLRDDLAAGRLGIGLLANLRPLLADHDTLSRHAEAVQRDAEARIAAAAEAVAQADARAAAIWQAAHGPIVVALVQRLVRRRVRRVALVGAGDVATLAADALTRAGVEVVAIGDNDARRAGQPWRNLVVRSVDEALATDAEGVLIASVAHAAALGRQVRRTLRRTGLRRTVVAAA